MEYEQLTRSELVERLLSEVQARLDLEASLGTVPERDRLLRELLTHQQELEAQNETLRESQRELEDSRKRYLDLYDSAPIPYFTFDRRGVVVDVNLPGAELLGKRRSRIVGRPLMAFIGVQERARLWNHLSECLASKGPVTCELSLAIGRDVREFQLCSTAVHDPLHPPETCRTAFLELTERRAADALAKLSAERLTSAFESIKDPLALYDVDARLVLCNSAYVALLGQLFPGPAIGKSYDQILGAWQVHMMSEIDDDEPAQLVLARRSEFHKSRRFELRTRDGRYLRVMNRPTIEGGIVQTVWDLTEDVRRERELSEARDLAERASAAKSDFLSSMSHELRTPLNAILGFAQLLQRDKKVPLDERHRQRVDHILNSGEQLLSLIEEILQLS